MLPATLITITTFLFKLCSASPIYNLQPAFITNTVGATTGRNIRHLPCISRRNSNQNGFCMFAIDCLKANGTHLGTCIDGFYFGSCCYLEPVNEIIDNTIDTDIIPHREPPSRVSSTTSKTSTLGPPSITLNIKINSTTTSTEGTTTIKNITNTLTTANPIIKETTSSNLTNDLKLQAIPSLGNNTNEVSTKISTISILNSTEEVTKNPVTSVLTSKTPTVSTLSSITASKIIPTKHTSSTLSEVNSNTTEKFHLVTFTESTVNAVSTKKPTKVTPTKRTSKPTKPSSISSSVTISKRPEITPTKSRTTVKPTKKISSLTKPTKKITTTSKLTTSKPPLKTTTTTTTAQILTNQTSVSPNTPPLINSSVSSSSHSSTTVSSTVSAVTTSTPNILSSSKNKTDAVGYKNNVTTSAPDFGSFNDTTKDWVPITTPDGWVLLSGIGSNLNQSMTENLTPSSSQMSSQSSSALFTNAMPTRSTMTTSTQMLPVEVPSVTVAVDMMIASSNSTNTSTEYEISSVSTTTSMESLSLNPVVQQSDNMTHFTNICGRRTYPEARIVGGEKSSFGKWPWQISLRQWRTSTYLHKCGAALLNENWAITAAHCVDNVPPSDLLLRLGEYDLSNESEPYLHQERRVQIVASHPQFDPRTFEYDLALLRFYEPVNFQPNIIPICVPQTDENFVGRIAYVTGWGRLYEDGPLPSVLQEVSVPVINNTVCESMYRSAGYIEHIPHIFICAGWRRGGFDSCEGDSGGPMVIQRPDKRFLLAGVISWGIGCAEPNQPGVYTRISEFRDWINQILQF